MFNFIKKRLVHTAKDSAESDYNRSSEPIGQVLGYDLFNELGRGAFGVVFAAKQSDNPKAEMVALKLESTRNGQVTNEVHCSALIDSKATNTPGFVNLQHIGQHNNHNAVVMDLLGSSLDVLFFKRNKRFSLNTVVQIGHQVLNRLEHIHQLGLVHRDLKPENLVVGRVNNNTNNSSTTNNPNTIHLVDFGLAKMYNTTEEPVAFEEGHVLTGTVKYASVNTHMAKDQSRRDDLESLCYVLIYFVLGGCLPWGCVCGQTLREKSANTCQLKRDAQLHSIKRLPVQLANLVDYCRELEFNETPDYQHMHTELDNILVERHIKPKPSMDWS